MLSVPLLSLLAPSARGFAPPSEAAGGVEPHRIQYVHPVVQAGLLQSEAWTRFASTDGVGWTAVFDEATGTPRRLWGQGIAVPTTSGPAVAGAIEGLLERHRALLGVDDDATLSLKSTNYSPITDTWYVEWDVLRDGVPTFRKGLGARVKHGNLVMLTAATDPGADVRGGWSIGASDAIGRAIAGGPAPSAVHTDQIASRTLLEVQDLDGLHLQRVWQVESRTASPPGRWVTFVDAATGGLVGGFNQIRMVSGVVSAYHQERTLDGTPPILSPVPLVKVESGADVAYTDADGQFDLPAGSFTTTWEGDYLTVLNDDGPEGELVSTNADLEWAVGATTPAEASTYIFVHQARNFGITLDPTLWWITDPFTANVNIAQNCNAYFDGTSLNFFHTGGGCNNTGQIADVVYHEWGHGFHASSVEAGFVDGALGEGAADTYAFLITGDNEVGPYFFTDGGPVRDVAPDAVYPDDYFASPLFVHESGLIFGGAMWDTRDALRAKYGPDDGVRVTAELLTGLLKGGPDIVGSYYEAIVADDDDGDLLNGTPNQCELLDTFGRHGLAGFTLAPSHEPLATVPADVPTPVSVALVSTVASCIDVAPSVGTLHYKINRGDWQTVAATISGLQVDAEVPAQPLGTFVEYYVDGEDDHGVPFGIPTAGQDAPYSFFVGDVIEVHCDDFEADDGGWTHSLEAGDPGPGADDWEWGNPSGLGGDPSFAFSGNKAWGNDLSDDGIYQPDKMNYLVSPPIPTGHFTDVFVQYRRWLNAEDATYDLAMILANDDVVWSNTAAGHHIDDQWVSHSVWLNGRGDMTDLTVGFGIRTDPGLEMGGWNVDDVCVYAPATADNRLGIDDFVVTDLGGPIGFSWTNPSYGPVTQVVVVRKTDAYPTGHEDGEIVATIDQPALGSAGSAEHANVDGSAGYYAVYATDGTEWLGWTIEGFNAGFAERNAGGEPTGTTTGTGTSDTDTDPAATGDGDGKDEAGGGCGCDATGAPAVGWLLVPVLGFAIRRRR
ncbi:MAG: hypothetical protein ABMB14_21710 [Myxococcota bacterium]